MQRTKNTTLLLRKIFPKKREQTTLIKLPLVSFTTENARDVFIIFTLLAYSFVRPARHKKTDQNVATLHAKTEEKKALFLDDLGSLDMNDALTLEMST